MQEMVEMEEMLVIQLVALRLHGSAPRSRLDSWTQLDTGWSR